MIAAHFSNHEWRLVSSDESTGDLDGHVEEPWLNVCCCGIRGIFASMQFTASFGDTVKLRLHLSDFVMNGVGLQYQLYRFPSRDYAFC